MKILVPPIKCQGIKTKLVPLINQCVIKPIMGRWIEPFCGSGVVALNIQPKKALLTDTNKYIIALYRGIQNESITPSKVKDFLEYEGNLLSKNGENHYYEIRERFNQYGDPLDFLFLNRSCFNGVMRFNRKGKFNVPFGHKPDRFRQAYITKIVNQVKNLYTLIYDRDWIFEVANFEDTLTDIRSDDMVYCDPPYQGRHVDYFNTWSDDDELRLINILKKLPCRFLLSTWHSNKYRINSAILEQWDSSDYTIRTIEHFYHVGSTEDLRNAMTEALIANYPITLNQNQDLQVSTKNMQQSILDI